MMDHVVVQVPPPVRLVVGRNCGIGIYGLMISVRGFWYRLMYALPVMFLIHGCNFTWTFYCCWEPAMVIVVECLIFMG